MPINLQSTWTRKNDGRSAQTLQVDTTVFADDTTLHGLKQELHESDNVGPCGMDVFSQAVHKWGSSEHQGKRERYIYGSNRDTCLVGGGIGPSNAVNRNIQRGLKCWRELRPALKGSRLSHKQLGRILMAYVYSPLAYSAKTCATRLSAAFARDQVIMSSSSLTVPSKLGIFKGPRRLLENAYLQIDVVCPKWPTAFTRVN